MAKPPKSKAPSPAIALLVSRMRDAAGKGAGPGEAPEEADAPPEGEMAAAEEALDAVRQGDAEGFARALKSFIRLCTEAGYDEASEAEG